VSDKNLEQRINIKFCENISRSVSEMLAMLTLAYSKYGKKISSVFEWNRLFKKGEKMCQVTREVGSQKRVRIQIWTKYELWYAQIED
jgi:hypothetical protein